MARGCNPASQTLKPVPLILYQEANDDGVARGCSPVQRSLIVIVLLVEVCFAFDQDLEGLGF